MDEPGGRRSMCAAIVLCLFGLLFLWQFLVNVRERQWSCAGVSLACTFLMLSVLSTPGLAKAPAFKFPPVTRTSKAFMLAAFLASFLGLLVQLLAP